MKHINIIIKGKVQGVWYRKSTQQKAQELGLVGFVTNEANGDVYIEAEGAEDAINLLLAWCNIGPKNARVDSLQTRQSAIIGFKTFEIK